MRHQYFVLVDEFRYSEGCLDFNDAGENIIEDCRKFFIVNE